MKPLALVLTASLSLFSVMDPQAKAAGPADAYSKVRKIKIGGDGGWDYLSVDPEAHRLYVSRGNRLVVVDTESEKVVGEVTDTPGVHGAAIVPELSLGFTSNGGDSTSTAFDTKTLKSVGKIKIGAGPDAIFYDPDSKRVYTFNHGSKDATVIDPKTLKVAGTIALDGVPEAAVFDGKGHLFVNLMDKSEIADVDVDSMKVVHRWPLAPGVRPTGLAFDREHRRLFSACSANDKMIVMDANNGKVLADLTVGKGSDGAAFDSKSGLAFSSNGRDGTLSIVKEEKPGQFAVVATVPTQMSARTCILDPKTHRVYLSAATFEQAPAGAPKTKGRPPLVPGSFVVIVVGE